MTRARRHPAQSVSPAGIATIIPVVPTIVAIILPIVAAIGADVVPDGGTCASGKGESRSESGEQNDVDGGFHSGMSLLGVGRFIDSQPYMPYTAPARHRTLVLSGP